MNKKMTRKSRAAKMRDLPEKTLKAKTGKGVKGGSARSDGGGSTVGRANFDVFTVSKVIDTSTTKL
jgi:hypothetical protein